MIEDIQTDKNLSILTSAISKLASSEAREQVYEAALERQDDLMKVASSSFGLERDRKFPLHTPEDAMVSKVYFDDQQTKLAESDRRAVGNKIEAYLNLYSIPESMFETAQTKTADTADSPRYLLPNLNDCPVYTKDDLVEAGEVFSKQASKLSLPHRVEFAQNFCKLASEWEYVPYPSDIAKYAGVLDTDMANLSYMLEIRSAAASQEGQDGGMYTKLAHSLLDVQEKPDREELTKLAHLIHEIDTMYGFDDERYDSKLPDAFSVVFNKQAEDAPSSKMDKSTVVARYGLDALEAVEDEEGNIDENKVKQIESKYGKPSQSV